MRMPILIEQVVAIELTDRLCPMRIRALFEKGGVSR